MKDTLIISLTIIFLTSCNSRQADNQTTLKSSDTSVIASAIDTVDKVFFNPFRDINSFDVNIGFTYFDSLNNSYSKDPKIEILVKKDLCAGDHCCSFRSMTDKSTKTAIHLFKGDNGEYGFSNDQFILKNDSLQIARNFIVSIKEYPTDSSSTIWNIEETIYYFYKSYIKILKRQATTEQLYEFDFSLKNTTPIIESVHETNLYKEKYEELVTLLASEDMSD